MTIFQDNELVNALIWKVCPRDVYLRLTVLKIGTSPALINVNNRMVGMLRVLANMGYTW